MLNIAQDTIRTQFEKYEDMPLRVYAITFMDNDDMRKELPEQVYQGRSVSEAVQRAEIDQLDKPRGFQLSAGFKAAWQGHWESTSCTPRFIVGKVRDLGLVMNRDEQISDQKFVSREEYDSRTDELIAMTKCRDDILAANEKRKRDHWSGL